MKKGIRLFAAILSATMLVLCLAGCGEKTVGNDGDLTELVLWSNNTASRESFQEIVDYFNESIGKKDGVKLIVETKEGGTITQNIELALQTDEAPDFFSGGDISKLAEQGFILAINDMPGTEEKLERYKDKFVEKYSSYKGKAYRMPISATTQALVYNKDMFRAAGIVDENGEPTPPKTFAQMREYAKKLTNTSKKQYGIILPIKFGGWFGSDIWDPMLGSVGHKGYDPVTGKFDYTGLAPIMDAYLGMKADGSVYPGAEGIDNDPARATFAAGNIGMKMAFSFDISVYHEQFPAKIDWGVAPYPVIDENETYLQRMDYGVGFFVNKSSPERVGMDKVMSVWNFFTGDEYMRMSYERGLFIPADWEIVKDVEVKTEKKGWKEFAELVSVSHLQPPQPSVDDTGLKTLSERFISEVWTGEKTPSKMLEEYSDDMNKAKDKYYALYTDEDANAFVNPDWNIKR